MAETLPVLARDHYRWQGQNIVRFGGGPRIRGQYGARAYGIYRVPRDTMDPRFVQCTDHHVACDCREAELSEQINELRAELQMWRDAADRILAGHPTEVFVSDRQVLTCECSGCQLARAAYHFPKTAIQDVRDAKEWRA